MASYTKHFLYTLIVSCIFLVSLIEATKKSGITLSLIHRDSQHSPTYDPTKSHFERLRKVLRRSFSRKSNLRANYLTTRMSDDFESPLTSSGGEYLIKIQIGTPPVDVLAIADTGSDLTWTQCKPCKDCYKQKDPLFDPRKTSSYRRVSCESEQCTAVGTPSCDSSNTCNYQQSYGDQSYSLGELAVETVTFGSDSGDTLSFPKVVFGCGHENAGTFNETASGIVGLGGGSLSIIKQLSKSIGGRFSYCLTSLDSKVSSKIKFGTNAIVTGPKMVSTPMVRKAPDTFYYLTLEGISVGDKKFAYKSNYNANEFGEEDGNIIIDSGTTLTFIPRDINERLESELVDSIKATRGSDSRGVFNLCYKLPSDGDFNPPPVVAHFSGADVKLPKGSTFIEIEKGLVCLALLPSDDIAIFGNLHQMNYHIGYDLQNQKVNFLPTDCSKSK